MRPIVTCFSLDFLKGSFHSPSLGFIIKSLLCILLFLCCLPFCKEEFVDLGFQIWREEFFKKYEIWSHPLIGVLCQRPFSYCSEFIWSDSVCFLLYCSFLDPGTSPLLFLRQLPSSWFLIHLSEGKKGRCQWWAFSWGWDWKSKVKCVTNSTSTQCFWTCIDPFLFSLFFFKNLPTQFFFSHLALFSFSLVYGFSFWPEL